MAAYELDKLLGLNLVELRGEHGSVEGQIITYQIRQGSVGSGTINDLAKYVAHRTGRADDKPVVPPSVLVDQSQLLN